ncbi:HlyD family efflux transporter periplasmic adaptor subunit [Pseudoalteromonas sp. L23]|uniref:HlyD family efflux transporter periplasmic adaptor subunit n=1 Tax=unclassified Pseudoalteromonas TaxID=194690 RepID=UPI001EEFECFD|nr:MULTISPECIES: HlyD family efflux transporter periplasmic adaptor subunit [unclassified Pseudoalteromonas]MCF7513280.1 HlyD family efflux transporter periplasmic adaptor subunit [Pseudoalteromonas sp. L7]MCF7525320.1 HlyD family efflux transporter periplasmic adaptor subunit [Pseudoalteromonas sp. L23]
MDTIIENPKGKRKKIVAFFLLMTFIFFFLLFHSNKSISSIPYEKAKIIAVTNSHSAITSIGTIRPMKSIKLSSDIGGRVKSFINRQHTLVEKGDVILELENYDYTLKLTEKMAQISEQISNLENMRLNLRRELTSSKLSLEDALYNVDVLERELDQKLRLLEKNLSQKSDVEDIKSNLTRWKEKQGVLTNYYQSQHNQITHQLKQIGETVEILNSLLLKLQESEQQLLIRAPITGNLVGFDVESGQQILPKEEFASLDMVGEYLIEVELNEFYLERINKETRATAKIDNKNINLKILKIFPLIKQGKFKMNLEMPNTDEWQDNIKVGQSVEIELANSDKNILPTLPAEATFQKGDTTFVYLHSDKQSKAIRTPILIKERIGDRVVIDAPMVLGKSVVILDWNKKYKEELYIE